MRSSGKATPEDGKRKGAVIRQEIRATFSTLRLIWMLIFFSLPVDGLVAVTLSRVSFSAASLESLRVASVLLLLASVVFLHPERTIEGVRGLFSPMLKGNKKISSHFRAGLIVALLASVAFVEVGLRISSFGVGPAIAAAIFFILGAAKIFSTLAKVTPHASIVHQLALVSMISPVLARSGAICGLLAFIGGAIPDHEYGIAILVAAALLFAGEPTSELFLERCPQCHRLSPRTGFVSTTCEQCAPPVTSERSGPAMEKIITKGN